MAARLASAGVSANAISIAGMVFGVGAGMLFALTTTMPEWERALWLTGAACVQLRLLANMLDGMVAIARGSASRVGELYNEVPDRVSDAATIIGLGYAAGGAPWLGYLAALLAVLTAYIRAVGKAAGGPSDFRGPMAKQQRMTLITVAALYLALAPMQWRPAWGPDDAWGLPAAALAAIGVGCLLTFIRRLRRIAAVLRADGDSSRPTPA
jgi:phosphatidylglycerophosphate synthase